MYIDNKYWIPLGMLPQIYNQNIFVEPDHLKMYFTNVLILLTVFNKDRQTAKSITFKKSPLGVNTKIRPYL
jgi:hypothetical protein